jgi:hypothetical protein
LVAHCPSALAITLPLRRRKLAKTRPADGRQRDGCHDDSSAARLRSVGMTRQNQEHRRREEHLSPKPGVTQRTLHRRRTAEERSFSTIVTAHR